MLSARTLFDLSDRSWSELVESEWAGVCGLWTVSELVDSVWVAECMSVISCLEEFSSLVKLVLMLCWEEDESVLMLWLSRLFFFSNSIVLDLSESTF